ncbi:winged helix-turn-helix domain-containing protein [Myceligenerans pegani]|uniref:Winged helix-turn-helix domain-containing protein n=1 Tax=Myceligenerans pegani TaxID=2776917 RepID=A0ABR9N2Q0_9MICO|nr:winged helix-turn-helix domain-containing protein [Myceligenerans sp. TRM 65318]MBE1877925.1 winged helix-turn-helix domain-containing protein [Myceligenerans sp. TRM 65318]MBE3020196.1 winged helix-turn-helix domain-containing protein [Myceligenerans sp. TRM 65318]
MTRIAPRPGSDAYIVCVGLPPEIVAQVVHVLGGQHAVLVVPDSDSAVNLLAPDRAPTAEPSTAADPEEPVDPAHPYDSARSPQDPPGGRVVAFPPHGRRGGHGRPTGAADSFPGPARTRPHGGTGQYSGSGPYGRTTPVAGGPPTGQVPVVTGAIPAVSGAFPVVPHTQGGPIGRGPLTLDLAAREVRVHGREVHLSAQEFDLLATLASQPGRVWTFAELTAHVWGTRYLGDADAVTSAIKRLRRRLPRLRGLEVASVRGVGYRLRVPE